MKKFNYLFALIALLSAVCLGLTSCTTAPPLTQATHGEAPAKALPTASDRPTRLTIPRIGVDGGLQPVGLLADGAMETPPYGEIGWYDEGPPPGAVGASVIVAHVHGPQGDDVFARLHELRRGDRVRVDTTGGQVVVEVEDTVVVDKDNLPYERMWPETRSRRLSLITCAGEPSASGYPANTVVFAHAI